MAKSKSKTMKLFITRAKQSDDWYCEDTLYFGHKRPISFDEFGEPEYQSPGLIHSICYHGWLGAGGCAISPGETREIEIRVEPK